VARRSVPLKHYFLKDINWIIRLLITSDVVLTGAAGLLGPIFAIFVSDFIVGGNAAVAGLAASIYLLTKSLMQIPIATIIDRIKGEKDDFYVMFVFTVAIAFIPLLYLFISTPLQLYAVQFVLGLFTAATFPSYMAIFTRHIDRKHEGLEWGVYFTLTDFSSAALAAIGGFLAETAGFTVLIILVTMLSFLGSLFLWPIRKHIR